MAKSYIIIDHRGRATIHAHSNIEQETTTRLASGESFQVFEATALSVSVSLTEAKGSVTLPGTKKRGRPPGKKSKRKTRRASRKAGKKARTSGAKGKVGRPRLNVGSCTVDGCSNPSKTRGLCSAHYQKHRRLVQEGKPGLISGGVVAKKKRGRPPGKKAKKTAAKAGARKAKAKAKPKAKAKTKAKATVRKK